MEGNSNTPVRTCHFEASEDIMAKFKSQESNIENLVGVATLPLFLIPALWKIAIYVLKSANGNLFCTRLYLSH